MNDQVKGGFDPSVLLGATMTEANTRRPPIPSGTVLLGTFGKPDMTQSEGKQEKNLGVVYTWLEIPVTMDLTQNPAILAAVFGPDAKEGSVTLTWKTSIDLNSQGGFDMGVGKNNGLRQLRTALDMNNPGQTFNLVMIEGRQIRAIIGARTYNNDVYDQINSLAKV